MLPKALISILVSLQLLPASSLKLASVPSSSSTSTSQTQQKVETSVSVPDEVYADLALQHELGHVSVYYFDSDPKNNVSIDATKNWDPASTIKLYAAMYAFDQVSHGNIKMDQLVTIDSKNVAASQSYPNGYPALAASDQVDILRLLNQMITQSDNTAYNTLLDILGRQQITKYIHDLGLINSTVGSKLNLSEDQQQYEFTTPGYGPNLITAEDFARAFILINGGRIPGSNDLFNILSRQKLNSMLPARLPKEVVVAHKTGELDPYYHDGGIVVDPKSTRKYVLAVLSDTGNPNVVAHLSQLVYTTDIGLVGSNDTEPKNSSSLPNPPIDPIVEAGEPSDSKVLATNTQNIKLPKVTASDIGITASDISGSLEAKQLPSVIFPVDSPAHFLIDLGKQLRVVLNPIPQLRTQFETENLKLTLAEANDLIKKGKQTQANILLTDVDQNLSKIAKDQGVSGNKKLQETINQISETRFSILGSELNKTQGEENKLQIIKEVASQAANANKDVKPYTPEALKSTDLSQTPVVGEVVRTTQNSITVKTSDGNEVTTPVDTSIKTRDVGTDQADVKDSTDIPVGSTIALTSNFILTNIASDSANVKPVTVIKVNEETNTLVIAGSNGIPQQVDLTGNTVIKGIDTSISLDQIKPGDVIVGHGQPLPAATPTPNATTSPVPSSTSSPSGSSGPSSTALPSATPISTSTSTPVGSSTPTTTALPTFKPTPTPSTKTLTPSPLATSNPKATSTPTPTKSPTPAPKVIQGNVIQVIQGAPSPAPTAKPTTTASPTPKK